MTDDKLNPRMARLLIGLGVAAAILLVKLFSIQILDDKYKTSAQNNSMVYDIIYPTRGVIYDRNGKIIVGMLRGVEWCIAKRNAKKETLNNE